MMASVKGTALVTGASRRIGLAIAAGLVEAGYDVALHASARARTEAEAEAVRLAARGARIHVVVGDLADADACAGIVAEAAAALGPLSLLVNNAAIFERDEATAFDLQIWERHFAVNLRAPVILAQHFAVQAPPDRDASIINVIDQRVLRPTPQFFSYSLSKSALWMATRTMAQAFAERGIRVNAIGPGPVLPNSIDGDAGFSDEVERLPLRRSVAPEELAAAVLYLSGARNVTGQIIVVDAGQHLGWRASRTDG